MSIDMIRERYRCIKENDLIGELRNSLISGASLRKRFRLQLWEILTGEKWDGKRNGHSSQDPCITCKHWEPMNGCSKNSDGCENR